ncbi:MAG: tyrosine-type recombinase/integrase [Bryobacterales bacterium]|nr:tyrosine-type recombinase/integrase [Bryobacterales bacterium]
MKLSEAFSIFLHEVRARKRSDSTFKNYDYLFRDWTRYANKHGLTDLNSFTQDEIRLWRDSWTTRTSTTKLRLTLLRTFFRFAVKEGWIDHFPMSNVLNPKVVSNPTLPFNRDEMLSLVVAAEDHIQEKALILLMRYAGLSIQDAVTCSRNHINGDTLILRRAKTGELVIAYLPDPVIESLRSITLNRSPYFFWSGESKPATATKFWRQRLKAVARKAGVADFKPHRLRDTFAVELLSNDVSIEDVSTLLGHSSINTTERHYAPWNKARRNRLIQITQNANLNDPLLQKLSKRSQKN